VANNIFGLPNIDPITGRSMGSSKKKRRSVSFNEKVRLWELNRGHICHICHGKIHSLTEAQVDHVRANSKGGDRVSWAHSSCNRMKGNKPLSVIHRRLGIKSKGSSKKKTPKNQVFYDLLGRPVKKKKSGGIFGLGF